MSTLRDYDLAPREVVVGEDDHSWLLGVKPPLLWDERNRLLGRRGLTEAVKVTIDYDHAAIMDFPKTAVVSEEEIREIAAEIPPHNGGLVIYDETGNISDPTGSVFEQVQGYRL